MAIGPINNMDLDFGMVTRKIPINDDLAVKTNLEADVSVQHAEELVQEVEAVDSPEEVVKPRISVKPSEEFEFNLKRGREFNLIGANSKLEDLDVPEAVSDIKKDAILNQYRFFVNTSRVDNSDGTVRRVIR